MTSRAIKKTMREEERLDRIFHALSDRTRRALLAQLANGPSMVTDLSSPVAMSRPAISKHLKILEEAQLISRNIDGRVHLCSLSAFPLRKVEQWISFYRNFWEGALDSLAHYVENEGNDDAA